MEADSANQYGGPSVGVLCVTCGSIEDGQTDVCTSCGSLLISGKPLDPHALTEWVGAQLTMRGSVGMPSSVADLQRLQSWAGRPEVLPSGYGPVDDDADRPLPEPSGPPMDHRDRVDEEVNKYVACFVIGIFGILGFVLVAIFVVALLAWNGA